jgi:hypothetical protein
MAGGYLRPDTPASFDYPAIHKLIKGAEDPTLDEILQVARDKRVGRLLVVETYQHPTAAELKSRFLVQFLGGVMIAPACGYPGIAERSKSSSS